VAILGPRNFDYIITILALTKLGHTVQFLSTRISQLAVESLIDTTGATHLLADPRYLPLAAQVQTSVPLLRISSVAGSDIYDFPIKVHADTRMDHQLDSEVEASNIVYSIHSSGEQTTILLWLHKLLNFNKIDWATKADLSATEEHNRELCYSMDMKVFITLPLYHNHGICNFFRAIYSGKSIHIYNVDIPLTQNYLTSILRKHNFEIFYGVPDALKLLAKTEEGIELLRQLRVVMDGGSAYPDTLGDFLVEQGVNLVGQYGASVIPITTVNILLNRRQHRSWSADDVFPTRR
jgi:acyl-CoA synthetase (AMP-forming)/AMP-acid ligase II